MPSHNWCVGELVWPLPFALLVCVQEILARPGNPGIMPLLLSMSLMWRALHGSNIFNPRKVSGKALNDTGAGDAGVGAFLHYPDCRNYRSLPSRPGRNTSFIQQHLCAAGIMFLLNLNHVLTRLGAMSDPILRADIKLFVTLNSTHFSRCLRPCGVCG